MARLRRKAMRWIVERAAEQRLLWHLRTAPSATLEAPDDLSPDAALAILNARAQARLRPTPALVPRQRSLGLIVSVALILVPGPNVLGYYFTFTTVGHLLAWRGAAHGLKGVDVAGVVEPDRRRTASRADAGSPASASSACTPWPSGSDCSIWRRSSSGWPFPPRDRLQRVTLRELAERLGAALEGDGAIEVTRVAGIEQAGPGDVTFLANAKYAAAVADDPSLGRDPRCRRRRRRRARCCGSPIPYLAFARAAQAFAPPRSLPPGVHPSAVVAADAVLEDGVAVGPLVVIGRRARIGAGSVLYPHVVVGDDAVLGVRLP